jgi:hypothetical protein
MNTLLAATLFFALFASGGKMQPQAAQPSSVEKITPIIYVEAVEPCLKLWVDRLGFTKTAEVPEDNKPGNRLGFVILVKGPIELMLQTRKGADADGPALASYHQAGANLYIEVADFPDLLHRIDGYPVIMPTRDTFYGMREISIKEPGGNILTFAAPIKK